MADYSDIANLFEKDSKLKKFSHKRWVKIHPTNDNYGENVSKQYNCRTIQDKVVNFHDGFLLLDVRIARNDLAAGDRAAPKGPHSFINQAIVRMNNNEIENCNSIFLSTEMQNQLEFSQDYTRVAKQFMWSQDTGEDETAANHGHTERIAMIPAVANHRIDCKVKIPLSFVSNFFRSLDFPLMNQLIEIDVIYRLANAVLQGGAACAVTIRSSALYLPIIELPDAENTRLMKAFSSKNFKKTFAWSRLTNRSVQGLQANIESSHEIEPSIDGARKLYVCPKTNFDFNQGAVDLHTTIKLRNFNIIIDSEDFYPQSIQNDEEAYELISENFNMGGKDPNTGCILDYKIFKTQNSFYVFDLSRQKVFQSDPRKSQSIRFRCTPSANCQLLFILAQEKETTIDFVNPLNTKTV